MLKICINWLNCICMQAIALSLKDSGEISGMLHSAPSQHLNAQIASINKKEENTGRRKRKSVSILFIAD